MNKYLLLLLCLPLVMSSCGSRKKATTAVPAASANISDVAQLGHALDSMRPDFRWMRMNGSATYQDPGTESPQVNIAIKMRKDSLVWSRVSFSIIEVAKLLANKDSLTLLNRQQKSYQVMPVSGLEELTGISGLDIHALQSVLLGRPPFGLKKGAVLEKKDGIYSVSYENDAYKERMELNAGLTLDSYYYEKSAGSNVKITYTDYRKEGDMLLPHNLAIEIMTPDKININLSITEYTLLPTDEAPFIIPPNYTRN
jgi:hypothetical protein